MQRLISRLFSGRNIRMALYLGANFFVFISMQLIAGVLG